MQFCNFRLLNEGFVCPKGKSIWKKETISGQTCEKNDQAMEKMVGPLKQSKKGAERPSNLVTFNIGYSKRQG